MTQQNRQRGEATGTSRGTGRVAAFLQTCRGAGAGALRATGPAQEQGAAPRGVPRAEFKTRGSLTVSAVLGAAVLSGCGLIPTPSVDVKDTRLSLPSSGALNGKVVYLEQDALAGNTVPAVLQQITVTGSATYRTPGLGTLSSVNMYVRPNLTLLPASCSASPATATAPRMVVCDAAGEQAQFVGTLSLKAGQATPFSLGGPALDSAAKGGHGYFGMAFTAGQSVFGDTLSLSGMKASARL
ncbi:hypothetical protein LAJ19_08725 [Deinococcus taeanensis]|uniref:hypothetical protein n=1 Tax=Deinococcus taeanensis TaxID=2737050 RepID=UPI001CDBCBF7|nr:hypothetical protein [Deinococcus taeanensis]UBV41735.1 hypothetical protein LAJ19_08725 [Deinococcus taeanensis]